jgi:thioredoxin 1
MSKVTVIPDQSFESEVLNADSLVLVYFWASWCGPCRLMAPVVETVAADYADSLKVVKMEIDPNPVTVAQAKVQGVPAFRLFKQGEIIAAIEGAITKPKLEEFFKAYL